MPDAVATITFDVEDDQDAIEKALAWTLTPGSKVWLTVGHEQPPVTVLEQVHEQEVEVERDGHIGRNQLTRAAGKSDG